MMVRYGDELGGLDQTKNKITQLASCSQYQHLVSSIFSRTLIFLALGLCTQICSGYDCQKPSHTTEATKAISNFNKVFQLV
jgi:hypothetical protein